MYQEEILWKKNRSWPTTNYWWRTGKESALPGFEILLETSEGMLTIKGNDLHINRLSVEKGDLEVEGRVDALLYSEVVSAKAMGESFLGRMFK